MCGIAGILRFDDAPVLETQIVAMRDSMLHRGNDSSGIYLDKGLALGHRRLSIIDLTDKANQPFTSADGRYTIVHNGEIYNYKEFIPELTEKNVQFRSQSDTEVLLYLYIHYGEAMLDRLHGMWAFAIWDNQEKELFVSRDRLGTKPLYYTVWDNALYFASEPKALFTVGIPLHVEEKALNELFFYRFVAGANTVFKNIFRLLPGHCMYVSRNGTIKKTRYWHLGEKARQTKIDGDPLQWFEEKMNQSVRYRMVSDVPVGVLLSAGIDSCSIVQSLSNQGYKNIDTFTIGFKEKQLDESPLAKSFAQKLGYNSYSFQLEGEELYNSLLRSVWALDEPIIHQSDPQMVSIADHSKGYVKVLLSGEGADEMLGGYVRYKPLRYWGILKLFAPLLKMPGINSERLMKLRRYLNNKNLDDAILLNASNFYPSDFHMDEKEAGVNIDYRKQVLQEAKQYFGNDIIKIMLYVDQHVYLPSLLDRNDRTTMAAGIECREPYLDNHLVEGLMSLPSKYFVKGKKGKYLLQNSIGKYLPNEIQSFRKIGFGVPWERYFREMPQFREVLSNLDKSEVLQMGLLGKIDKKKIISKFLAGDNSQKMLVRFLFFMRLWETEYLAKFKQ